MSRTIQIDHLCRVEGHGGITVVLDGSEVSEVRLDVLEGIRLFESLVVGHSFDEIQGIVSRICAICSHAHSITALLALEKALGVRVSPQTRRLRDLGMQGGNIESHALHAFFLALPDFVGQASVVGLAHEHPEVAKMALRLKKLGNRVQEVVGGRAVHPVNYVLGGFGAVPSEDDLVALERELGEGLADCEMALEFVAGVALPDFVHEPIRCAALVPEDEAFLFGETLRLSGDGDLPVDDYRRLTNEQCVPHSHAKHSVHDGRSYMVGALARFTLLGPPPGGLARAAWERIGPKTPSSNILTNNLAQVVEMIRSVEHARALVQGLLRDGPAAETPAPIRPRAGAGAAATEAPRGTLFHWYELDARGRVIAADVITPTSQNLRNVEDQMRATVRDASRVTDETLQHRLEMVARAYDPCISCSVHVLRS